MRFIVMFVTAVCVLFLIKLRWPKKKNFYDTALSFFRCEYTHCFRVLNPLILTIYGQVAGNMLSPILSD